MNLDRCLELLQLGTGATPEQAKQAYRKLALDCHPDMKPGDPESKEHFQLLNEAYHTYVAYIDSSNGSSSPGSNDVRADMKSTISGLAEKLRKSRPAPKKRKEFYSQPSYAYEPMPNRFPDRVRHRIQDLEKRFPDLETRVIAEDILFGDKPSDEFVSTFGSAEDKKQMSLVAMATSEILTDFAYEFILTGKRGAKFADTYKELFSTLVRTVRSLDDLDGLDRVVQSARQYVSKREFASRYAQNMSSILVGILDGRSLKTAGGMLENMSFICTRMDDNYPQRIRSVSDKMKELEHSGLSPDDTVGIIRAIDAIDKRQNLRFPIYGVNRTNFFIDVLAGSAVGFHDLPDFVDSVAMAANGYHNGNSKPAQEEWGRSISQALPAFRQHYQEMNGAFKAIGRLKYDSRGVPERWPGIFKIPVEFACTVARGIVENSVPTEDAYRLFDGFRTSVYYSPKQHEKDFKQIARDAFSSKEESLYRRLGEVMYGRDGVPKRKLTMDDAHHVIEVISP